MPDRDATLAGKRVWVTRPARQARPLCRLIEQHNGVALRLPTLVIRALEGVSPGAARVQLADARVIIFTSKNAVLHARELFPDLVAVMRNGTLLAVGRATAGCLRDSGLGPVEYVDRGGSDALLRLPALAAPRVREQRVVIVRGQGGRESLREGLLARGAEVSYLEVYRRDRPVVSRAEMSKFWHDQRPDAVVITSLAGLDNMLEMAPEEARARLLETDVVVMSERIRQYAAQSGFTHVAVATDNTDAGLLDALINMNEDANSE